MYNYFELPVHAARASQCSLWLISDSVSHGLRTCSGKSETDECMIDD